MKNIVLLTKAIVMLYHDSKLNNNVISHDTLNLAKDILKITTTADAPMGMDFEAIGTEKLKDFLIELVCNPVEYVYSKTYIVERLKLCTIDLPEHFNVIENLTDDSIDGEERECLLNNLKSAVGGYFKFKNIDETLGKATSVFRYRREEIPDIKFFMENLISDLTRLTDQLYNNKKNEKDPGHLTSIDFDDFESVLAEMNKISTANPKDQGYICGWNGLNQMCAGSMMPGELVVINALKHNYKTGFTLGLFAQLATKNKPKTTDPNLKPTIVRINLEDIVKDSLDYLYQYLKHNETREHIDTRNSDREEMTRYVINKLQETGFKIKMEKFDPTTFTFAKLKEYIEKLECEGHNIEIIIIDYLLLMPTTGIEKTVTGIIGFDKRDFLKTIKGFCQGINPKTKRKRDVLFITPHQLSSEAKTLIRANVNEDKFVSDVANKGYFDGCKTLDNEMDIEIYIHKVLDKEKNAYLTVQRGKLRRPVIIPEAHKYFVLEFPPTMPIPEDVEGAPVLRSVPKTKSLSNNGNSQSVDFDFDFN